MENIIILGIVIVSVIINIIKNYQKESKKNSERVIGKQSQQINKPASSRDNTPPYSPSPSKAYDSLEYNIRTDQVKLHELTTSDYIAKYDTVVTNITANVPDEQHTPGSSANIVFETSEELKKVILYSTILERKF